MKEKNDNWYFIKTKNFLSAKDTIKIMERHSMNSEKIFAKGISDKGLVLKIDKNSIVKKKWKVLGKDLNKTSLKIYRWQISRRKDVQQPVSLEHRKFKKQ